jgi:hypothetical protein
MRSQLRLRVFLPVAVLGLLGIGVGAFAMGGPPGDSGAPLTTATTTATTTEAQPGPPSVSRWARQANRVCAQANSELRALGAPLHLKDVLPFFEKTLEVTTRTDRALVALGWPAGEKARVQRSWRLSTAALRTFASMIDALKAGDQLRYLRLFSRLNKDAKPYGRIVTKLGATRCAQDPWGPADPERGLAGALKENKVVVVLFYAPRSTYDAIQAREARAGAAGGGAGFLAVDVSKDRYVAALATAFEVRDAPAILVVTRGFRVSARLDGFADRVTIAQAASNARL